MRPFGPMSHAGVAFPPCAELATASSAFVTFTMTPSCGFVSGGEFGPRCRKTADGGRGGSTSPPGIVVGPAAPPRRRTPSPLAAGEQVDPAELAGLARSAVFLHRVSSRNASLPIQRGAGSSHAASRLPERPSGAARRCAFRRAQRPAHALLDEAGSSAAARSISGSVSTNGRSSPPCRSASEARSANAARRTNCPSCPRRELPRGRAVVELEAERRTRPVASPSSSVPSARRSELGVGDERARSRASYHWLYSAQRERGPAEALGDRLIFAIGTPSDFGATIP